MRRNVRWKTSASKPSSKPSCKRRWNTLRRWSKWLSHQFLEGLLNLAVLLLAALVIPLLLVHHLVIKPLLGELRPEAKRGPRRWRNSR